MHFKLNFPPSRIPITDAQKTCEVETNILVDSPTMQALMRAFRGLWDLFRSHEL